MSQALGAALLLLISMGMSALLMLPLHLASLVEDESEIALSQDSDSFGDLINASPTPSSLPTESVSPILLPSPSPSPGASLGPTPSLSSPSSPLPASEAKTSPTNNCGRPYLGSSPWNTKLGSSPTIHPKSSQFITSLTGTFGADVSQYTYSVYQVIPGNPTKKMRVNKTYSDVIAGATLQRTSQGMTLELPIPDNAEPAAGDDSQFILINPHTGDEWGFYEVAKTSDGWQATNGYHYNTNWSGVPPSGFGSRGAGVPYLAGLIRKCEIERGTIDHAIAFAHNYPCSKDACARQGLPYFVYPATKSDGYGTHEYAFPEGTRLQLNPQATEEQIKSWCTGDSRVNERSCRTVVKALQEYGMITIDQSGHPKIYAESELSASWGSLWHANIPRKIPYSEFRVINF